MMPVSMLLGAILHNHIQPFIFVTPYLIFVMLFISYANLSFKDIRFTSLHLRLLAFQFLGVILAYFLLLKFNTTLAQSSMMCFLAPTATSAVVITGMLGGNKPSLIAYSILSNMVVVFLAPVLFVYIKYGLQGGEYFVDSLFSIFKKVSLLLLLPLILSLALSKFCPAISVYVKKISILSFILWNLALIIVTGNTINFIVNQSQLYSALQLLIVVSALFICVLQFVVGRKLGRKYNDAIAGGQSLGQKNTILAIWMTQTYLDPLSSMGPGSYILWQNIINSYQIWKGARTFKDK